MDAKTSTMTSANCPELFSSTAYESDITHLYYRDDDNFIIQNANLFTEDNHWETM